MFRKNQRHLQPKLLSDLDNLSAKARARLESSWAGVFRREFFGRLDETAFAVLYSDEPSRPNTPINVLVGLEAFKAGFGWSDAEMHDAFLFNLQVRYALGYDNVGEGDFDLRTVYNFRRRVCQHMRKTGENLIEQAFEQVTDEQVQAFALKTDQLRMDSTQISSNVQRMSRLQLLVEILQRVHRILSKVEQAHYADAFAPYLKGSSGQYVYHIKGEDTGPHLQRIGELMQRLLNELAPAYESHETYKMLQRVFDEQFIYENLQPGTDDEAGADPPGKSSEDDGGVSCAGCDDAPSPTNNLAATSVTETPAESSSAPALVLQPKPGTDISPASLRSPDDQEITYRKKGQQEYEGYVVNLAETCDPSNPFQLILKVQSEPNLTEDTTLLEQALPDLKARTDVHTLYNDAGFCSPAIDELLHELQVAQVPSNMRGRAPDPNRTALADCDIRFNSAGQPVTLSCPHGYTANIVPGRKEGRYFARWADTACPECCFSKHLSGSKSSARTCLRFSHTDLLRALRRQRLRAYHLGTQFLRAAVEATVGALKRPFNDDQVPVRGKIRLGQMMIGSAIMVNIRRIQRYKLAKSHQNRPKQPSRPAADVERTTERLPEHSFLSFAWLRIQRCLLPFKPVQVTLVFRF